LLLDTREGLSASVRIPGIGIVIVAAGTAMLFGGIFNVIELPFATGGLDTTASGYSVLVTAYGLGFIWGSLQGASGGSASQLKRRFGQGLALTGAGTVVAGVSPNLLPALAGFALGGFGNGLSIVHERLLLQTQVPRSLHGRIFAVCDGVTSWGFAVGFLVAGALAEVASSRTLMLGTGAGELILAVVAVLALRAFWVAEGAPAEAAPLIEASAGAGALWQGQASQQGPHLVTGAGFWLTLLDDLHERRDDLGVELGPGVRDQLP
jgi:MFS family permease